MRLNISVAALTMGCVSIAEAATVTHTVDFTASEFVAFRWPSRPDPLPVPDAVVTGSFTITYDPDNHSFGPVDAVSLTIEGFTYTTATFSQEEGYFAFGPDCRDWGCGYRNEVNGYHLSMVLPTSKWQPTDSFSFGYRNPAADVYWSASQGYATITPLPGSFAFAATVAVTLGALGARRARRSIAPWPA